MTVGDDDGDTRRGVNVAVVGDGRTRGEDEDEDDEKDAAGTRAVGITVGTAAATYCRRSCVLVAFFSDAS